MEPLLFTAVCNVHRAQNQISSSSTQDQMRRHGESASKADSDTSLRFDTRLQYIQEANEARLLGAGWLLTMELFPITELLAG